MLNKIKNFISSLFSHASYDYCYTDMEKQGIAAMGCCCGVVGGDNLTDYLSYTCVSCPHLVLIEREVIK